MARFVAQYVVGSGGRSFNIAFDPEAILVVNPTSKTVYVRFGALDVPNTTERSDFFVLPRMAGVFPIKSPARSFAVGDGDPVVDPQPGEDGRCQIIVVAGEPIPALSPLPITYVRSDARVTNASLTVSGSIDANVTNASIPVTGNVHVTNTNVPVSVTNTNVPVTVTNDASAPLPVAVTNWPTTSGQPSDPNDGPTTVGPNQISAYTISGQKPRARTVQLTGVSGYPRLLVFLAASGNRGLHRAQVGSDARAMTFSSPPTWTCMYAYFPYASGSSVYQEIEDLGISRGYMAVYYLRNHSTTNPVSYYEWTPNWTVTVTTTEQFQTLETISFPTNRMLRGLWRIDFAVANDYATTAYIQFRIRTQYGSSTGTTSLCVIPLRLRAGNTYTVWSNTPIPVSGQTTLSIGAVIVPTGSSATATITIYRVSFYGIVSTGLVTTGGVATYFTDTLNPGQTSSNRTVNQYSTGVSWLSASVDIPVIVQYAEYQALLLVPSNDVIPFPVFGKQDANTNLTITNAGDRKAVIYFGFNIHDAL